MKQSQVRTNRAAFVDASMSRAPASTAGCCATMPMLRPPSRANPVMMFGAHAGWISRNVGVVDDELDDAVHVVWLARVVRHDPVESWIAAVGGIRPRAQRRVAEIVLRQMTEDPPRVRQRLRFVVRREVRHAAARRVRRRAAEHLGVDVLVRDRLSRRSGRSRTCSSCPRP